MRSIPEVTIVGAGVGGLALANALTRIGAEWRMFEAAPEVGVGGTGLTLWPNALRALSAVGLDASIRSCADPLERGTICDRSGRVLKEVPLAAVQARSGLPLLCLRRADLYAALLKPLDRARIAVGSRCTGYARLADGARLSFADGREVRAGVVVAADGVRSRLRERLLGADPLSYVGWMTWRGVARLPPGAFAPGSYREFFGRGSRFGVFWIRDDQVYWYGTLNSAAHDRATVDPAHRAEALAHFADWPPIAGLAIASTAPEDLVRTGVYDTRPLPRWTDGGLALLGDAAHPMTPDLGQGACQAIEDAIALVRCLEAGDTVAGALAAYERIGLARTAPIVARSRRIGKLRQWQSPPAALLRNAVIRAMPERSLLKFFEAD